MRGLAVGALALAWAAAGGPASSAGPSPTRLRESGDSALAQGDRAQAVALLLTAVGDRIAEGDYELAEEAAAAAVETAPGDARAWAALGRSRALGRRYSTAEQPLRRALELQPGDVRSLLYLASCLWETGQLAEAEGAYRLAIDRSGRATVAVYQLGRLLLWEGRFAAAAELLNEVAEGGASADLALDLARALDGAGNPGAALQAYRSAVGNAPDDYQARYGLARLLGRLDHEEESASEFEHYRRLYAADQERTRNEGLDRGRIDLGYELVRQGRSAEAIAHLLALRQTPDALAALAGAYLEVGDEASAIDAIERAVALAPRRQDLRARLTEMRTQGLARP